MIQVKTNDKAFLKDIQRWADVTARETADIANGIAVEALNQVLRTSPQYSGDFAGNWNYSINVPDVHFEMLHLMRGRKKVPFQAGDLPAIHHAQARNKGRDTGYKLGDTFYLTNAAVHYGENYAVMIETGQIKFRPGHTGATASNAVAHLGSKYKHLTKAQSFRLREKKL